MRYLTNDLDAAGLPTWAESDQPLTSYNPVTGRFWEAADDDEYGGDMMARTVTTPHGIFRACVRYDNYPNAPEHECGDPVHELNDDILGDTPVYGSNPSDIDIAEAWSRLSELARPHMRGGRDTIELVDRWLRIFHDGAAVMLKSPGWHETGYVVWSARAIRESYGCEGDIADPRTEAGAPSAEEWTAYLEGDVYVVSVERQVFADHDDEPTWETLDDYPVYGFYGDYAYQAAEDELVGSIAWAARDMLPLGGE